MTVDAEDHTTTDSTLSIVRDLRTEFPWLGTVLQAYLKRTEADCAEFAGGRRPHPVVQGRLRRTGVGGLPGRRRGHRVLSALPAHADGRRRAIRWSPRTIPPSIAAAGELAREFGRDTDGFEYQMLYGIRDGEQRRLAAEGNHVRVYVPFGTQWYGYFVRRLAERPANLMFFLRALAHRY